jgi:hypothetical protein
MLTANDGSAEIPTNQISTARCTYFTAHCTSLRFLLASSILEEPKYEIKGLQYHSKGSKPQDKTFEYNSVDDADYK